MLSDLELVEDDRPGIIFSAYDDKAMDFPTLPIIVDPDHLAVLHFDHEAAATRCFDFHYDTGIRDG